MKRLVTVCLAATMALTISAVGTAGTIVVTDPGPTGVIPSSDQAKIGTGSWQANGTAKSSIYISPTDLGFSPTTTIADIDSMSFSTFKSTTGGLAVDWYLTVYTAPPTSPSTSGYPSNNGGSWYGLRMTWEGLYANNFSNPANQWNTFSTDSGTNQLTMHDSNTTNDGFYGGPTLADIQSATNGSPSGVIDWSLYSTSDSIETFDYDESPILWFALETGSGWASGYDGYLDEFSVTVGGSTTTVDFESSAVPEPATSAMLLGLLGAGGVGGVFARRRKRAATRS